MFGVQALQLLVGTYCKQLFSEYLLMSSLPPSSCIILVDSKVIDVLIQNITLFAGANDFFSFRIMLGKVG